MIGIDKYQRGTILSPGQLRGCLVDIYTIFNLLTNSLNVPLTHIKLLQNSQATCEAVLGTFETYPLNNPDIRENDTVIFYFTAYGNLRTAPKHWHSEDGGVETICSYDTVYTNDIPDYTPGHLVRKLTHHEGNNIVLSSNVFFSV